MGTVFLPRASFVMAWAIAFLSLLLACSQAAFFAPMPALIAGFFISREVLHSRANLHKFLFRAMVVTGGIIGAYAVGHVAWVRWTGSDPSYTFVLGMIAGCSLLVLGASLTGIIRPIKSRLAVAVMALLVPEISIVVIGSLYGFWMLPW